MSVENPSPIIRDWGDSHGHIKAKRSEIGVWLLLYTNGKPYMGCSGTPLDLTVSDLEKSKTWSFKFWRLASRKGANLAHM